MRFGPSVAAAWPASPSYTRPATLRPKTARACSKRPSLCERNDVPALAGLVEVLPTLGRAPAAIRAARRLGHLSPDPDVRFRAHLTAGTLLRDELKDLPQARREIERALKLKADHPDGLEALALTSAAEGNRSGATAALAVLAARAEAAQDIEEAARLLTREGELWLDAEPERALERYRRAHELAPNRVGPLAAMAEAARRMGDEEVERSAVTTARDRLGTAEDPGAGRGLGVAPGRRSSRGASGRRHGRGGTAAASCFAPGARRPRDPGGLGASAQGSR